MSLMLPGWLTGVLDFLGVGWPSGNEDGLAKLGGETGRFAGAMHPPVQDAHGHAQAVLAGNEGPAVTAYAAATNHPQGPHANLTDALTGTRIVGVGLGTCGLIVLGLKAFKIVDGAITAAELTEAVATAEFGGLSEIPLIRQAGAAAQRGAANTAVYAVASG